LFLSGLSNRPANALGGEGDGASVCSTLKKQSQSNAELLGDENESADNFGSEILFAAQRRIFVRDKKVLVNFVRGKK